LSQDLTAGTFAGATSLVVGHPFDTIKVTFTHSAQCYLLTCKHDSMVQYAFRSSYKVSQDLFPDISLNMLQRWML